MPVEFPVVSFISALIVLVPLPWHWKSRNVCTISMILWLAASNIIRGINTIVWFDNMAVRYEVWCDIISRVELSANIGVPAATVCMCRRLAHVAVPYHRAPSPNEKRQRTKFEIGMCFVLPAILNLLHIAVEPCRFAISEGFGCSACHYPSIPALILTQVPTVLLSWVALIYSGVTLRWLIHRRVQFQQTSQTKPTLASGRYLRLIVLTVTQMTFASVMSLFLITIALNSGTEPWTSWEDVHQDWREIFLQPKGALPEWYYILFRVGWYFVPIASVTTFGYFGFDERVLDEYRGGFGWVKLNVFRMRGGEAGVIPPSNMDAMSGPARSNADALVTDIVLDPSGLQEAQPPDASGEP